MPAKLIAGEPAAIRRSFSSNHSYPGKTLADERRAYREALLTDAQRRIDRHVRSPCGERRLTTTSLPGRSAREGTSSAGPTMPLYTTWTRSPRRRPAFARASRLAWLFATMLPASRSGRAGSHCTSGSHPPRPRVRGRSRVRSPSHTRTSHYDTITRSQPRRRIVLAREADTRIVTSTDGSDRPPALESGQAPGEPGGNRG